MIESNNGLSRRLPLTVLRLQRMLDVSSKGGECRQEVDETDELTNELVQVAPNMRAGGSHLQATSNQEEEERNKEWTRELCEIRRMVEFLVRQKRVAVRRLERLEKEKDEEKDEEQDASLTEALADKTVVPEPVVDKEFVDMEFVDKGFGFGKVHSGEVVFIHASVVQGAEHLTIGTDTRVQVVSEGARAQGYRACARGRRRRTWRGQVREADSRTGSPVRDEGLRGVRPPAWLTRRARRCTERPAARNGQPFLLDCHSDRGKSFPRGSEFFLREQSLRQPRRRVEVEQRQPRESEKPRHCGNDSKSRRKVRENSSRDIRVGDRRKETNSRRSTGGR